MENRKNTILLTVIAVATLLVAVVGATFAYFTAQGGSSVQTPVKVNTAQTSNGSFVINGQISINATQENFYQGAGNQTSTATATVTYTASSTAASDFCYTVGLQVTANNFVYTTAPTNTPELTFTARKNANASDMTSATTLIDAQDITTTTASTTIQVPTSVGGGEYKHQISATQGQKITDQWDFTVTLVNLESDQNANTGKAFTGQIVFTHVECGD